jgi:hypothetical protein
MQPSSRPTPGRPALWGIAITFGVALAGIRCGTAGGLGSGPAVSSPSPVATTATVGEAASATPGVALDAEHTLGPPIVIDNLAVFPVYARVMEDIGEYLSLDDALAKGTATVREMGAEPQGGGEQVGPQGLGNGPGNAQAYRGDGAQVNTLAIENKGDLPILVLAGTVVKGGKQDRQIGQDFIIGKRQTVPVDAFCVEHGRWTATRNGVATQGSFQTLKTLAAGGVRAAGQYEQNQSEVWSKVGKINRATGKETASDTLTASLEDGGVAAEQARAAAKVHAFLAAVPMADRTVGLAYAVGGEVTGVRWFIHHKLFARYDETLVNTAVVESFTARAVAKAQGQALAPGACAQEKVAAFVTGADRGRHEERKTAGENTNAYEFSDDAYAAEAQVKSPAPASAASPPAKPKAVTKDYLRKQ